MSHSIHRSTNSGNVATHTGSGFVVGNQDRLDVMARVGGENFPVAVGRRAAAPFAFDHLDIEIVTLAEIDPAVREHAVTGDQHLVTGRQRVGHGRFPTTGAAGREGDHFAIGGAEHLFAVAQDRREGFDEVGRTVVAGLDMHRAAQAVRDIGGAWDKNRVLIGHGAAPFAGWELLPIGRPTRWQSSGGIGGSAVVFIINQNCVQKLWIKCIHNLTFGSINN